MTQNQNPPKYDLEARTFVYAKDIRSFVRSLKSWMICMEDRSQLIRSSGSVAANYIEANESLSSKDFAMRIKISRKEAKESLLWLKLIDCEKDFSLQRERERLIQESIELGKIFGAILKKIQS